jgi:very-short-patch-repair endonuclease
MDVLKGKGFEVVPQLGVAGFRIDIAVKHPGHKSGYLAAIECDGASYHSGVSVRDRDRIRQEILEGLGWRGRIWRIWSTDWFRNPLSETDRLLQFLEILRNQPIADEYIVPDVLAAVPQPLPTITSSLFEEEEQANKLVFADEDEDLEIQVGDLITYAPLDLPDNAQMVKLTARQTDPSAGLVSESTPLGAVLLGAVVGDQVVLRVPGVAPQSFVILGIKRSAEAAMQ